MRHRAGSHLGRKPLLSDVATTSSGTVMAVAATSMVSRVSTRPDTVGFEQPRGVDTGGLDEPEPSTRRGDTWDKGDRETARGPALTGACLHQCSRQEDWGRARAGCGPGGSTRLRWSRPLNTSGRARKTLRGSRSAAAKDGSVAGITAPVAPRSSQRNGQTQPWQTCARRAIHCARRCVATGSAYRTTVTTSPSSPGSASGSSRWATSGVKPSRS